MAVQKNFKVGLAFDDVLLRPGYADFKRRDIDLKTKLTKNINLDLPFVSAPMDTVTEHKLAINLAKLGGIGLIHRNLTIEDQTREVQKVRKLNLLVGAAVGAGNGYENRVRALVKAGVSVMVVDSAHGHAKSIIDVIKHIKQKYPNIDAIGGNIATSESAKALIEAGADGLRVGMGPGAICTTRIVSGMGIPQITAIMDVASIAKKHKVPVIADGSIRYSGDMVKAIAAGASTLMMGNLFARAVESPGEVVELEKENVPARFKSILKTDQNVYKFKSYRGMGSESAMKKGAEIKSESEFHGKSYYKDKVLVAEGVDALVPINGTIKQMLAQAIGGIHSGMYYTGSRTILELQNNAEFIQITQASLTESHPHSILITNPGESYKQ